MPYSLYEVPDEWCYYKEFLVVSKTRPLLVRFFKEAHIAETVLHAAVSFNNAGISV